MRIGMLNQRIMLQRATTVVDQVGNRTQGWVDYRRVYATVSGVSASQTQAVGVVWDSTRADFTIRYSQETKNVTAGSYRVVFAGWAYSIVGVEHFNYKNRALKLLCARDRDSGG